MDFITLGIAGIGAYVLIKKARSRACEFTYRKAGGAWRAYFNGPPPSRSHILHDSYGYYVCWDRPLRTEREARQVAKLWMKNYG